MTPFARSAGPMGKCTEELKTKVPLELRELADRHAHALGMSTSEWLRDLVSISLLGEETVISLYQERVRGVSGLGRSGGQK